MLKIRWREKDVTREGVIISASVVREQSQPDKRGNSTAKNVTYLVIKDDHGAIITVNADEVQPG
jgi:hypothetical protein